MFREGHLRGAKSGTEEWSHKELVSYAGEGGFSRESHRKRIESLCTGACACGRGNGTVMITGDMPNSL